MCKTALHKCRLNEDITYILMSRLHLIMQIYYSIPLFLGLPLFLFDTDWGFSDASSSVNWDAWDRDVSYSSRLEEDGTFFSKSLYSPPVGSSMSGLASVCTSGELASIIVFSLYPDKSAFSASEWIIE